MESSLVLMLIWWTKLTYASSYNHSNQNNAYYLKQNLVVNPQISTPVISPWSNMEFRNAQSGWATKVQYVEYIDPCLLNQYYSYFCSTPQGFTCGWQFLDTDSYISNEQYYQAFNLFGSKEFQLQFDWISEIPFYQESTGYQILWNGDIIATKYDGSCQLHTQTYYLIGVDGVNELVFQGIGIADSFGILIRNIKLQQIVYQSPALTFDNLDQVINGSQYKDLFKAFSIIRNFELTKSINTISSLKQNAKCFAGFILQFNHLLLYNYHLANYTLMSNIILTGINSMEDQKGSILDSFFYPLLGTSPEGITSDFQLQNNLPVNINNVLPQLNDYVQRPNGILLELTDMLLLDLPIMLVIFSVGYFTFRLLFRYRLSVVFRQYSILGCFFYMFWQGKIEVLTFYFLSDVLLLVNVHFEQKVKTVLILVVYYSVFVFAVGGMLLLKANYTRLLKYIYDNCKNPEHSSFHVTFEFGLFNLILGFTHRILLNFPLPQLYLLIVIETAYLTYLTVYLARRSFENMILGVILWSMNCARLIFIVTFLVYELSPELEPQVSVVQEYFLYSFVLLWGLSSFFSFADKLTLLIKILFRQCTGYHHNNKVKPQSQQTEDIQHKKILHASKKHQASTRMNLTFNFSNNESIPKRYPLQKPGISKLKTDRQFHYESKNTNLVSTQVPRTKLVVNNTARQLEINSVKY